VVVSVIPFVAHWRRSALACLMLLLGISTGLILGCGGGSGSGGSGTPSGGSAVTPSGNTPSRCKQLLAV
jgi:hypothetical protein